MCIPTAALLTGVRRDWGSGEMLPASQARKKPICSPHGHYNFRGMHSTSHRSCRR